MKNILTITLLLYVLLTPVLARADSLTYQEAWVFHYDITVAGTYEVHAGAATLPASGPWNVRILAEDGTILSSTPFDPAAVGTQAFQVPYQDRGYEARIVDAKGAVRATIGLSGSRTCDDNGVCDAALGENADNCPTDCGSTVTQQAAISRQAVLPGGLLLVLADIVLIGLVLVVDRRRKP